jgi:TRAP-type C4-dicarboxylate transport system substrate-binding protein
MGMKKKNGEWLVFFVLFSLVLAMATSAQAQEKVVKLKYASLLPPVHPMSKMMEQWCKDVEQKTDGRVKVSYFPGNTLTPPTQTYDSVVNGIADIGYSLPAYSPGRFPLTEVLTLPLGFTSGSQATTAINEYYKKFRPKEFDDTKIMYFMGSGPGLFFTRKPITSMDGIKGLRLKANAENADIVKALGGAPVTMPITETYDALQKGLLEGVFSFYEVLKYWKFADVVKCCLENSAVAYTTSMYVVMNKDKWNLISKADQQAIEKMNEETIEKSGKIWNELDKESKEYGIQKGVKIVKVSKEEEVSTAEKMKPILAEYIKKMKAKGLPGEEAVKFLQDYIKAHP